jgi:dTDP-4-amino-4,6-dideoxygalactose transaminase
VQKLKKILISPPEISYSDIQYILNYIQPENFFDFRHNHQFESKIAGIVGMPYVLSAQSGTAALHLALKVLGVKTGDTVLCQSMTFVASANPILYERANPVFIDSEPETLNMDPELLEKAIQELFKKGIKPAAIIYVHTFGTPGNADEVMRIGRQYGIPIIEDAAEALGSYYDNTPAGNFGDISVFSFNINKIISTGGGGALCSKNKKYVEKARFLANQAKEQRQHYEHCELGYNYQLNPFAAILGKAQLPKLKHRAEKKRELHRFYFDLFKNLKNIKLIGESHKSRSNFWVNAVIFENYDTYNSMVSLFEAFGVEVKPLWKPMHMQPLYKSYMHYLNGVSENAYRLGLFRILYDQGTKNGVSENAYRLGLFLPSGSSMTKAQRDQIEYIIKKL